MALELFEKGGLVKICAPMVRYSKLPFRALVRKYGCDLAYTPMIVSNSFVKSQKARDNEFGVCENDRPLIVQFAASNAEDFSSAAALVANYSDGVDLNCGCPQRWAMHDGYGACLIDKPELVRDMVLQTRNKVPRQDFSVSIKIRIHSEICKTIDFCRQLEAAGVSYITVHGRTKDQRSEPVNLDAIKLIKDSLNIPVIANGDIKSLKDAHNIQNITGVNGVMVARAILQNPAMFAGYDTTPLDCIEDWIKTSIDYGSSFVTFHHHLIYMSEKIMSRAERQFVHSLSSTAGIVDYFREHYKICK